MPDVESLLQRYKDDVYRLALSYTRNITEAEDVCQTIFLKLMEQRAIQPGREKSWLMQVTANQCRSLLRSAWWRTTVPLEDCHTLAPMAQNGVYQAVMALEPKYRVVVYLHYYEQYTTREIAALLRIRQTTVTTRLSRARQKLKETLREEVV